jgi:hypothetical protein
VYLLRFVIETREQLPAGTGGDIWLDHTSSSSPPGKERSSLASRWGLSSLLHEKTL